MIYIYSILINLINKKFNLDNNIEKLYIPEGYKSPQNMRETQTAIKDLKDYFERALSDTLNLTRVSAPIFVTSESGINDNLNGFENL